MSTSIQPALAPAPPSHRQGQADGVNENVLREQLTDYVHYPQSRPGQQSGNIDPAIAAAGILGQAAPPPPPAPQPAAAQPLPLDIDEDSPKPRRELTNTKRAAQNRQAQRAFRMRKETHIKELEEQVRQFTNLSDAYKVLHQEHGELRQYVAGLQQRLDRLGEPYPPLPAGMNLAVESRQSGSSTDPNLGDATAYSNPYNNNNAPTARMGHDKQASSGPQQLLDAANGLRAGGARSGRGGDASLKADS